MDKKRAYPSDLTGYTFGRLTVIEPHDFDPSDHVIYKCRCSCGSTAYITRGNLISGRTKSCGCFRREKIRQLQANLHPTTDLTGRRFGRLVVLGQAERRVEQMWMCRCDCGVEKAVRRSSLIRGATVSCGCYSREVFFRVCGKVKTDHPLITNQ